MPTPSEFAAVAGIAVLAFGVIYLFVLIPVGNWLTNRAARRRAARERNEIRGGE